jgi:ribosome-associated translation inhibitor RaiA
MVLVERAADLHAAIDAAMDRLARVVTRRVERVRSMGPEHAISKTSA